MIVTSRHSRALAQALYVAKVHCPTKTKTYVAQAQCQRRQFKLRSITGKRTMENSGYSQLVIVFLTENDKRLFTKKILRMVWPYLEVMTAEAPRVKQYKLRSGHEFRFEAAYDAATIELVDGSAEIFGFALGLNRKYTFPQGRDYAKCAERQSKTFRIPWRGIYVPRGDNRSHRARRRLHLAPHSNGIVLTVFEPVDICGSGNIPQHACGSGAVQKSGGGRSRARESQRTRTTHHAYGTD